MLVIHNLHYITTVTNLWSVVDSKDLSIASVVIRNGSSLRLPSSDSGYVHFQNIDYLLKIRLLYTM